jgi:hypothetical protein
MLLADSCGTALRSPLYQSLSRLHWFDMSRFAVPVLDLYDELGCVRLLWAQGYESMENTDTERSPME